MPYINLVSQITELDKQRITNYISEYGKIKKEYFIGINEWLRYWSHSKQKLYKLLGNKLIYKAPFEYEKDHNVLRLELNMLYENSKFLDMFYADFLPALRDKIKDENKSDLFNCYQSVSIKHLVSFTGLLNDKVDTNFKYKAENKKNTLQISKGMKPIKAIQKVLNYFDFVLEEDTHKKLMTEFEKFRLAHSRIFNNKIIKGQLCISIHPLDFMTMSDNNMGWTSCMSWRDKGCYHEGTIEMMNSNNVVCCYIESDDIPFYFNKSKGEDKKEYRWNNKKLRELAYVTKDIIMNGKSYPYNSEDFNETVITTLKNLANKNLKWSYSFGPEVYKDMDHFFSGRAMNVLRRHRANNTTKKHSIIFDTKGMYNDILNDTPNNRFKCYRNKVKKTKIISISGKANCVCCNKSIVTTDWTYNDVYDLDYNDRYNNMSDIICEDCKSDFTCHFCGKVFDTKLKYEILTEPYASDGFKTKICSECFEQRIKECPCCKKPMFLNRYFGVASIKEDKNITDIIKGQTYIFTKTHYHTDQFEHRFDSEGLYACSKCESKIKNDLIKYKDYYIFKDKEKADPYRISNLAGYDINNFDFSEIVEQTNY